MTHRGTPRRPLSLAIQIHGRRNSESASRPGGIQNRRAPQGYLLGSHAWVPVSQKMTSWSTTLVLSLSLSLFYVTNPPQPHHRQQQRILQLLWSEAYIVKYWKRVSGQQLPSSSLPSIIILTSSPSSIPASSILCLQNSSSIPTITPREIATAMAAPSTPEHLQLPPSAPTPQNPLSLTPIEYDSTPERLKGDRKITMPATPLRRPNNVFRPSSLSQPSQSETMAQALGPLDAFNLEAERKDVNPHLRCAYAQTPCYMDPDPDSPGRFCAYHEALEQANNDAAIAPDAAPANATATAPRYVLPFNRPSSQQQHVRPATYDGFPEPADGDWEKAYGDLVEGYAREREERAAMRKRKREDQKRRKQYARAAAAAATAAVIQEKERRANLIAALSEMEGGAKENEAPVVERRRRRRTTTEHDELEMQPQLQEQEQEMDRLFNPHDLSRMR
ncbi:hypothetical protein F4778DRAFT_610682 [Xylariomycetidae sp. FL2044]|nr:hypothetical protein F4778DRAFT_610682 [Xylariomycetidae sp. FL2044]